MCRTVGLQDQDWEASIPIVFIYIRNICVSFKNGLKRAGARVVVYINFKLEFLQCTNWANNTVACNPIWMFIYVFNVKNDYKYET